MYQPELTCNLVARVAQNFKCQPFGSFQCAAKFGDLGRNGDQIRPQGVELFNMALQSLQLKIAIRSPYSSSFACKLI